MSDRIHRGADWLPEPGHPCTICLLQLIPLSCLVPRLARFACFVSFRCSPPSRTASSSQFPLPSRCRTTRWTHGIKANVSYTQNSYPCMQPNKITSRTGPITKTTKHDWVHDLSMHLTILDCLSIPALHHQSNQSRPMNIIMEDISAPLYIGWVGTEE